MSRFEEFVAKSKANDDYPDEIRGNGGFEYSQQVIMLQTLSNQLNGQLLMYLFGTELGMHLAHKFVIECQRNLLTFLSQIDRQYRFFILHELKTNEVLFAHC